MQQVVYIEEEQSARPEASLANRAPVDARRYQHEGGFLLLAVLLMMALMIIAASIEIPQMVQQLKRDREEEMIHRGTEYARAIRKYYMKFGSYPATLEQLDNTNQIRFLRKRYKDPLTKDGKWKVLTYGDILTLLNPSAPGTPAAALGAQGPSAFGQPSAITSVGTTGTPSTQSPTPGSGNIVYSSNTALSQSTPVGLQNQPGVAGSAPGSFAGSSPQGNAQQGSSPFANTFSLGSSSASNTSQQGSAGLGANPAGANQAFGGGAIVGVASLSKDPTIRIYNQKKTYNEWVFIYNPMMDQQNVLLRGPYQPITIGGAQVGTPAGQMNNPQSGVGQQQTGFGQQQTGFGQPSTGFGQQQNAPQQTSL